MPARPCVGLPSLVFGAALARGARVSIRCESGLGREVGQLADAQPRQLPARGLHAGVVEVVDRACHAAHSRSRARLSSAAISSDSQPRQAQAACRNTISVRHQQQPARGAEHDRHPGAAPARGRARCAPATGRRRAGVRNALAASPAAPRPARAVAPTSRSDSPRSGGARRCRQVVAPFARPDRSRARLTCRRPLRASLAMIQPAAKATPKEASGRSRIRSAALSIRSRPLSISASTCSRRGATGLFGGGDAGQRAVGQFGFHVRLAERAVRRRPSRRRRCSASPAAAAAA